MAPRRFFSLTAILGGIVLFQMTLSPYLQTRETELACTHWPFCFGYAVPPAEFRHILEFIRRAAAGTVFLILPAWLFLLGKTRLPDPELWLPALLAMVVIAAQAMYAGQDFTRSLNVPISGLHPALGLILITLLVYIWRRGQTPVHGPMDSPPEKRVLRGQRLLLGLVLVQVLLGLRLSAGQGGLDCPEFPACFVQKIDEGESTRMENVYLPLAADEPYERPISHRLAGYALWLLSLWLIDRTRNSPPGPKNALFFALLSVQILTGALSVKWGLPLPVRMLHSLSAITLYVLALLAFLEIRYQQRT